MRLGIHTEKLQEMMRKKNVRLIAVNDNYDSFQGEDDFLPFRNIMNEWYAKGYEKYQSHT
jgi:hypothetical protein